MRLPKALNMLACSLAEHAWYRAGNDHLIYSSESKSFNHYQGTILHSANLSKLAFNIYSQEPWHLKGGLTNVS